MKLVINNNLSAGMKMILSEDDLDLLELFAVNYHLLIKEEAFNEMSQDDQIRVICKEAGIRIKEYLRIVFLIDLYKLCSGDQGNFNLKDSGFILLFNEGTNCYSQIQFLEVEEKNLTFCFANHRYAFPKDKTSEVLRDKIIVHI